MLDSRSRPDVRAQHRRSVRLAALFVMVWGLVTPAGSSPSGARPAQSDFPPGTGSGTGRVAAVQLRSSGVSVAVVLGRATARYQGVQGNAEASVLDPGLLGTLLEAPLLCGRSVSEFVPPESLPAPLKVSSGGGETAERSDHTGDPTSPIRFGTQRAAAAPSSRAEAAVDGVTIDIPGVVTVTGGAADSLASLSPGRQRVGRSHTAIGSIELGGGLVRLGDLEWSAEHRSGEDNGATASFAVGSMQIAGLDVPVASAGQLARSADLANVALAPLGVELGVPEPVATDTTVSSPPVRITLAPTPLLLAALAPLNEQIQPLRTALLDLLEPFSLGEDCSLSTVVGFTYLVVDLVATAMSSGGGVDLLLGGATSGTDDVTFDNPFGSTPSPPATSAPTTVAAEVAPPPSTPTTVPPTTPASEPPPAEVAAAPVASTVSWCSTTHRVGRPACSAGAAQLAGLVALTMVAALAAVDRVRSRGPKRGGSPT